jgi:hypothetical protein
MNNSVTVYCTKYALTTGIFQLTGEITATGNFTEASGFQLGHYLSRAEYRLSREDAIADFEKRRAANIASLRKQIAKLEKMKPTIKDDTTTTETP